VGSRVLMTSSKCKQSIYKHVATASLNGEPWRELVRRTFEKGSSDNL